MRNHFTQHLCLRDIILEYKPALIVECGCSYGQNTMYLRSLHPEYPFRLISISDDRLFPAIMPDKETDTFTFIQGISYLELPKFDDTSIGLCIIDTDHNYYTLQQELAALYPKLIPGGLIALHDTVMFSKLSGKKMNYGTHDPYPMQLIDQYAEQGLSMGQAIQEFLRDHPTAKIVKQVEESNGAMLIQI